MPAWHVPRKVARLLRYLVLSAVVCTLACYSHRWCPAPVGFSKAALNRYVGHSDVDFAWGSILHRFQNHPRPPRAREPFPWSETRPRSRGRRRRRGPQAEPSPASGGAGTNGSQPLRVLIVTSELSGLHTNGGIGTAFLELAQTLASAGGGHEFETTILVAHLESSFPLKKREALKEDFATRRISLRFVDKEPQPFWPQAWTPIASMRVWRWLRARDGDFDVVHFPDNTGIGYFATLGKHEGLALENTKVVVGLHGADVEWAAMLNKRYPIDKYAVELGVFERGTAEMADAVIAPSEYMLDYVRARGWAVPKHALVIPNIVQLPAVPPTRTRTPAQVRYGAQEDTRVQGIIELVFFGRLEERKGTKMFVQALEALYSNPKTATKMSGIRKITFLGRDQPDARTRTEASTLITGALNGIREHTNATFEFEFLKTFDRDVALAYLRPPHRLALLPSLADNSPSTVLECIAYGIRFLTSNVGGIPELIHPEDRARVVASPLAKSFAHDLLETLERLQHGPWKAVRAAPATQTAAKDWIAFHHWLADSRALSLRSASSSWSEGKSPLVSICITHHERSHLIPQLLDSLIGQTEPNFEVILIDDGSTSEETQRGLDALDDRYFRNETLRASRSSWTFLRTDNAYLGEARNRAARKARGEWLLFLDDDDVLKPHALETLLRVARRTGVSALSTWLDEFATDAYPLAEKYANGTIELPHRRTYWFLGQELSPGLVGNSFGSGNIFVTKTAFARVGGFSTYRDVGGEDWEFWTKLALTAGTGREEKHLVVPEELIFTRSDPARDSMKFSMDPWDAHFRSAVPVLNDPRVQDLGLAHALMLLKGVVTREYATAAFADSRDDYQHAQGWSGWFYSFEQLPAKEADRQNWAPSLAADRLAMLPVDETGFIMDLHHLRLPFIDDMAQSGHVSLRGERIAAIRSFRSPKNMHVAVDFDYRSDHACGDGTRLTLVRTGGPGEAPETLASFETMEDEYGEFVGAVTLRPGNALHIVSDPLDDDACDRVEVHLKMTPIEVENSSWSALSRRAALARHEEQKAIQADKPTTGSNETWTMVADDRPDEDSLFNVALIFDRNRYPHAMSVIRSIQHFTTSRQLVFHLVVTRDLRDELEQYFAGTNMTLHLYDHNLCAFVAKTVLPFSNPEIHVSAHCKMFLSGIVKDAERILYLDTDVTVLSDLSACYGRPSSNPGALLSMAVDMGDACQRNPNACWPIGMHWRVPPGLECGNVPFRHARERIAPPSCAEEGELETLQVNGGVILFELARMKDAGFLERYVQSIVHHFRIMDNTLAQWGEQDFVNSFFRLFPEDLELLPCGCNYQWFGARREVKCGAEPVHIAHHWAHGIAARTQDPYNVLFYHFADNHAGASLPPVPDLSATAPGAPNSSEIDIIHTRNCPRQGHDCSPAFEEGEFGKPVLAVSRILSTTFSADLSDSLEAQAYPKLSHLVAVPEGVELPPPTFDRDEIPLRSDPAERNAALCRGCGALARPESPCTTPPEGAAERKKYFDCVCSIPDATTDALVELTSRAAHRDEPAWLLYMDDDRLFVAPESLSHLMARVDSTQDLILFRSNTSTAEEARAFKRKILPKSTLEGVGFLFHSSHLDFAKWDPSIGCGRWRLLNQLASRLRVKWIDIVPTMEHPLQRHLPAVQASDFKSSIVILETRGRRTWTDDLVINLQVPEYDPLVEEILVASVDSIEGAYGDGIVVFNPSPGSGLSEIAALAASDRIVLISDSVAIDKRALTSLLTFHLDDPARLVGFFGGSDVDGRFPQPLSTRQEDFDAYSEPDALVGSSSWTHLSSRTLLTSRSNLEELAELLDARDEAGDEPLHPICHPVLLSAISTRASGGLAPMRVLPPHKSITDRVYDCRQRNYPDVAFGVAAGDWATPRDYAGHEYAEHGDGHADAVPNDQLGAQDAITEEDDPLVELEPPTLAECIAATNEILGSDEWTLTGDDVGVSGLQGNKIGIEQAYSIEAARWEEVRVMQRCLRA